MTASLSICVHGEMFPAFLETNTAALEALRAHGPLEVIVWGKSADLPETPPACRFVCAGEATYNQALLALLRHATGAYAVIVDASDGLEPEAIRTGIATLETTPDAVAVCGGVTDIAAGFTTQLAPAGLLMRRETASRFLHITDYGLLNGWFAQAQLAAAGLSILPSPSPILIKRRVPRRYFRSFDPRGCFFDSLRAERYCAFFQLYDPVTLEHCLSDAEQFINFWPTSLTENTLPMFAKRAMLYDAASAQAEEDAEATIALHFQVRAQFAQGSGAGSPVAQAMIDRAVAEQIRLIVSLLGKEARLSVETHPALQALAERFSGMPLTWQSRESLLEGSASPNEVVVFYFRRDASERARGKGVYPGRQLSYEALAQLMLGPLQPAELMTDA